MLVSLVAAVAIVAAPGPPVVFHIDVPHRDGFVDATTGILDSVEDLVRLVRARHFVTVPEADQADLLVTVLARDVGSQRFGELTNLSSLQTRFGTSVIATSVPVYQNDYWVAVLLEAGPTYKKLLVGRAANTSHHSMGAWTECAKAIATELATWVSVNGEQIQHLRDAKK